MHLSLVFTGNAMVIAALSVATSAITEARQSRTRRPMALAGESVLVGALGGAAFVAGLLPLPARP